MDTHTHVVPFFTRRLADGREETVCGLFVTADRIAPTETRPDCWGCAAWVDNMDVIAPERAELERRTA